MNIEGLGGFGSYGTVWHILDDDGSILRGIRPTTWNEDLQVGRVIRQGMADRWVVTDVLGDGRFKAVPKQMHDDAFSSGGGGMDRLINPDRGQTLRSFEETFDISGKPDQNNPIYKFYEKEMSKYLKSKYGAQQIVDENGISWMRVPIKPEYSKAPVEAFIAPIVAGAGAAAAVNKSDEK